MSGISVCIKSPSKVGRRLLSLTVRMSGGLPVCLGCALGLGVPKVPIYSQCIGTLDAPTPIHHLVSAELPRAPTAAPSVRGLAGVGDRTKIMNANDSYRFGEKMADGLFKI